MLLVPIYCASPLRVAFPGVQHGIHVSKAARVAFPGVRHGIHVSKAAQVAHLDPQGALSVNFYPVPQGATITSSGGDGVLNLGKVSYAGAAGSGVSVKHSGPGFAVETQVGVRVGSVHTTGGTVMVSAWLEGPVAPYTVYMDGVLLGPHPALVSAREPLGIITSHNLKVVVPRNSSEMIAQFTGNIAFQVVKN
jgi:hypothetical protein